MRDGTETHEREELYLLVCVAQVRSKVDRRTDSSGDDDVQPDLPLDRKLIVGVPERELQQHKHRSGRAASTRYG